MSIAHSSRITQKKQDPILRAFGDDAIEDSSHPARMGRRADSKVVNHLRAWRDFRGMSQDELAGKIGTKGNVIHQLETGKTRLSDKWLRLLAPALDTTPGFLFDYDPNDLDTAFLQAALNVAPESRGQVLEILKTFRKTGTAG